MGYRGLEDGGRRAIVAVTEELRPSGGPAYKSMVSVITNTDGVAVASYVPWYSYGDLDIMSRKEPGLWTIVEPAEPYEYEVIWAPYGGR